MCSRKGEAVRAEQIHLGSFPISAIAANVHRASGGKKGIFLPTLKERPASLPAETLCGICRTLVITLAPSPASQAFSAVDKKRTKYLWSHADSLSCKRSHIVGVVERAD